MAKVKSIPRFPPGYRVEYGGEIYEQNITVWADARRTGESALVCIFLVLPVSVQDDLPKPLVVMSAISSFAVSAR